MISLYLGDDHLFKDFEDISVKNTCSQIKTTKKISFCSVWQILRKIAKKFIAEKNSLNVEGLHIIFLLQ